MRVVAAAAALGLFATTQSSRLAIHAQSSCGATINPVACENGQPGDLASEWDVSGSGDPSIQGFATNISVVPGEVVQFERLGYFAADLDTPGTFHRTVGLKDEWANIQKRNG